MIRLKFMCLRINENGNTVFPGSTVLFRCFDHDKKCPFEPELISDQSSPGCPRKCFSDDEHQPGMNFFPPFTDKG